MYNNQENKSRLIEKWKYYFSSNFLSNTENLYQIAPMIETYIKDKPIMFLNLEPWERIMTRNEESYTNNINITCNTFKSHCITIQIQVLWRVMPFLQQLDSLNFNEMIQYIESQFERRKIPSGDMVGIVAAQSISERFTQTTLNSFHVAGSKNAAAETGIKRINELLDALKVLQVPSLKGIITQFDHSRAFEKTLRNMSKEYGIRYNNDPKNMKRSNFEIFFVLQNPSDVQYLRCCENFKLKWNWEEHSNTIVIYSPEKMPLPKIKTVFMKILDMHIFGAIGAFEFENNTLYFKHGVENYKTLEFEDIVKAYPDIDLSTVIPNDIHFIYRTLGIEAVRNYIVKELPYVLKQEGIEIDMRHILLLADNMTYQGSIKANKYSGMKIEESVILKATFEQATKTLSQAAMNGLNDKLSNVSAQIMTGKLVNLGTNQNKMMIVDMKMDIDEEFVENIVREQKYVPEQHDNTEEYIPASPHHDDDETKEDPIISQEIEPMFMNL